MIENLRFGDNIFIDGTVYRVDSSIYLLLQDMFNFEFVVAELIYFAVC